MKALFKALREDRKDKITSVVIFAVCSGAGTLGVINPSNITVAFVGHVDHPVIPIIWGLLWYGAGLFVLISGFIRPLIESMRKGPN